METNKTSAKVLKLLFRDFTAKSTVTSLSKSINKTRVGTWKVLKKLEKEKLITLISVGTGKTSTFIVDLNWNTPIIEKKLSLLLAEEALDYQRWIINFAELENKTDFVMLYGSIIHSPKTANDVDILNVTSKNKFLEIEDTIRKVQKTQIKQIHPLNFTTAEFKKEIEKPNKVFIDAIKKGILLFGQEKFIKFIKSVTRK